MTPAELKTLRESLDLSQHEFGLAIGLTGKWCDRTIRRMESGSKPIDKRTELAVKQFAMTASTA